MTFEYVIQTNDLTRHFYEVTAVDHVTLQVPQGSIYGFLGPNGAGKTTTIRLLLHLIRPDHGEVHIFGFSLPQHRQAILQKVGALVELPSLYPHLSGYENLDITRRLLKVDHQQIAKVLNIVNLEKDAQRLVRGYSLGMCQRLALALALLGDPELLILDEPTNGLDPAGIREMRTLIKHLAHERGITIFLSSHLLNEVEQIATHIGIITNGKLIFQGTMDAIRARGSPYIKIDTNQPAAASQILSRHGFVILSNQKDELHVVADADINPAAITTLLVQNQIEVSQISLVASSLEDLFFDLTRETDKDR